MKKMRFLFTGMILLIFSHFNVYSQNYNSGYMPDELTLDTTEFEGTDGQSHVEFKNPYEGIVSDLKTNNPPRDEISEAFSKLGSSKASANDMVSPEFFDWKKSGADRFLNSPCFKQLGFNPNMNIEAQEEKYAKCEASKTGNNLILPVLILVIIITAVYVYIKLSRPTEIRYPSEARASYQNLPKTDFISYMSNLGKPRPSSMAGNTPSANLSEILIGIVVVLLGVAAIGYTLDQVVRPILIVLAELIQFFLKWAFIIGIPILVVVTLYQIFTRPSEKKG